MVVTAGFIPSTMLFLPVDEYNDDGTSGGGKVNLDVYCVHAVTDNQTTSCNTSISRTNHHHVDEDEDDDVIVVFVFVVVVVPTEGVAP